MLWNEMVSNGLVVTGVLVLASQIVFVSKVPKCLESAEMQGGMGNWEIGKSVEVCTSRFPNFPKDISPFGSALFGKLGNWEICRGMYFPISQFPKRYQPIWLSTIWEIWKSVEVCTSQFPNFPKDLSPSGSALLGKVGNWEMITGTYFPISQFPK